MNAITITGYKPYELNIRDDKDEKILVIKEAIKRSLLRYLENGVEWVLLSGQPGVETWAFDLIQELKEAYTIYTAIVPPFMEQEKVWKEPVQEKYYQMIQQADFYQPLMNKPYEHRGSMSPRINGLLKKQTLVYSFMKKNMEAHRNISKNWQERTKKVICMKWMLFHLLH